MHRTELNRQRRALWRLRNRLTDEVGRMIDAVPERLHSAGDLSHVPTHNADRDSEGLDREIALIRNEEDILNQVEAALCRIDEGSFGACEECGGPIASARLEALPFTPYCVRCASRLVATPGH